jgi:hypothetical protein
VGEQKFGTWSQLPPKERLRPRQWWGPHAVLETSGSRRTCYTWSKNARLC